MKVWTTVFALSFVMLLTQNCTAIHDDDSNSSQGGTLVVLLDSEEAILAQSALESRCFECHGSNSSQGGLSNIGNAFAMVDAGYIVPGSPEASKIYQDAATGRMPIAGQEAMTGEERQALYNWISNDMFYVAVDPPLIDEPKELPEEIRFDLVRDEVFGPKCLLCHSQERADVFGNSLRLESFDDFLSLVDVNNPGDSSLYQAIATDFMPASGGALSDYEKALVLGWIEQGARQ